MHEFTATNKYQDFACPEYPPPSLNSQVKLPYFIAYGLHHTRWSCSQPCLKVHFPIAQGFSGYKLFVSAFMLAFSKVICDDTYSNTSWSIVVRGMFQLREINQMEGEMCQYLELNVDPVTLQETILVCWCSSCTSNASKFASFVLIHLQVLYTSRTGWQIRLKKVGTLWQLST
jgi:hypothetical protein